MSFWTVLAFAGAVMLVMALVMAAIAAVVWALLLGCEKLIRSGEGRMAVRVRRRIANGLCLRCGYDLRGSKQICPECGMQIPEGSYRAGRPDISFRA